MFINSSVFVALILILLLSYEYGGLSSEENMFVEFDILQKLNFCVIFIFFASKEKNILAITFANTLVEGGKGGAENLGNQEERNYSKRAITKRPESESEEGGMEHMGYKPLDPAGQKPGDREIL